MVLVEKGRRRWRKRRERALEGENVRERIGV